MASKLLALFLLASAVAALGCGARSSRLSGPGADARAGDGDEDADVDAPEDGGDGAHSAADEDGDVEGDAEGVAPTCVATWPCCQEDTEHPVFRVTKVWVREPAA